MKPAVTKRGASEAKMTFAYAKRIVGKYYQLKGADRLRWLGYGTDRYDRNCKVIDDAMQMLDKPLS